MSEIVKRICVTIASVAITAVILYFVWQFILGIALLKSIVGIGITVTIIFIEIISIWWYFRHVKSEYRKNKMEELQVQQLLSSGNSNVFVLSGNTNTPASRKSASTPALVGLMLVLVTTVIGALIHQNQVNASSYLPTYGNPTLSDSLQHSGQWYELSRDFFGGSCQFINGAFHARETKSQRVFTCPSTSTFSDFAFEVAMTIAQGNCGGVNLRRDLDSGAGYTFSVCRDGTYAFTRQKGFGDSMDLRPASDNSSIHKDLNQANFIAITAQGNTITLYINRKQIATVQDSSYTQGHIAFIAMSKSDTTEVIYTDAKVWAL